MTLIQPNTFPTPFRNGDLTIPSVSYNADQVPLAFVDNCGTWEGTAKRVLKDGTLVDEHLVRVEINLFRGIPHPPMRWGWIVRQNDGFDTHHSANLPPD